MTSVTATPFLWYEKGLDELVAGYRDVFGDALVTAADQAATSVSWTSIEVFGQRFHAFAGGPHESFNDAFSFFLDCPTQGEVDRLWERMIAAGWTPIQCGWIHDPFGVRWQVVPAGLHDCIGGPDAAGAQRAMSTMMGQVKLYLPALQAAYRGEG